jgi:hypothetical protein
MKVQRVIAFLSALHENSEIEITLEDEYIVLRIHQEPVNSRIGFYRQQWETLKNVLDFAGQHAKGGNE